MIEISTLIQMTIIMISVALILSNWQPPIPKGQQGLICFIVGGVLGYLFSGFNFDGIMTGLIAASVAFWRSELFKIFSEVREETVDIINTPKSSIK